MYLRSFAKINLALDIISKRDDGYHNIETVMQAVDLFDEITIEPSDKNEILCSHPDVPLSNDNIAYKTIKLVSDKTGIKDCVKVEIKKNIPVSAGLAGGSGNSASVLIGLNELWKLGKSKDELAEWACELGSDVPFCIYYQTALAVDRGNKLSFLPSIKDVWFVIINPDIKIPTNWAYKVYDEELKDKNLNAVANFKLRDNFEVSSTNVAKMIQSILDEDLRGISNNLYNSFESVIFKFHPILNQIKNELIKEGAMGALMSGSGSTIFGICDSKNKADDIANIIHKKGYKVWSVGIPNVIN